MKNNTIILSLFAFLVLCGCTSKNEGTVIYKKSENGIIKIYYTNKGKIHKKVNLNNDSIKQGDSYIYYNNGNLKRRQTYERNQLNGIDSSFYRSGRLKNVREWVDGRLVRSGYDFYDKTFPAVVTNMKDTFIIETPQIKKYYIFQSESEPSISIQYGEDRKAVSHSGNSISSIYYDIQNLKIYFIIANPPFFSNRISIESCDPNPIVLENIENYNDISLEIDVTNLKANMIECIIFNYILEPNIEGEKISDKIKIDFSSDFENAQLTRFDL